MSLTISQCQLRTGLRKLFTEHAVYTKFVINAIVDNTKDIGVLLPRLLRNQLDIGNALIPIIGLGSAQALSELLQEHIKLAGEAAKAAVRKDPKLQLFIDHFMDNGHEVAQALTKLNPTKLPLEATTEMFLTHNQFVIDMVVARIQKEYEHEIRLYDAYYDEILEMSDDIFLALV